MQQITESAPTNNHSQFILLLPTKMIRQQLVSHIFDQKDFSVRFINGYRNVLLHNGQQFQWALVEDENYCGQAFCYLLKQQTKKQDILAIKLQSNLEIKQANQQMYILQIKQKQQLSKIALTQQQLKKLIQAVSQSAQSRKLALNLIKNAFDSYDDYKVIVGSNVEKIENEILQKEEVVIPTVAEMVDIEYEAKKVHGQMVTKVPKCNHQTGEWDENQHIEIKLVADNA